MSRATRIPPTAQRLARGDFVRLSYRLGQSEATGVLTVLLDDGDAVLLVLRRGQLFTAASDSLGRKTTLRLEKLAAVPCLAHFESGLAAYPPSVGRPFSLSTWARRHLEGQIDSARAQRLVDELAGTRLSVIASKLPDPRTLDATDNRILAAMKHPRRLDQIWPLARTPRFRLLAFVHFLRSVGVLRIEGIAAQSELPSAHSASVGSSPQHEALRVLGIAENANLDEVKRAYRRLARALHPDLQGSSSPARRRQLERELARINGAYRELMTSPIL